MLGLLPTRLVQTRKGPLGVWIVIILTPPESTSSRPEESKYAVGAAFTGMVISESRHKARAGTRRSRCCIFVFRGSSGEPNLTQALKSWQISCPGRSVVKRAGRLRCPRVFAGSTAMSNNRCLSILGGDLMKDLIIAV